jgi:hypothetical protein
MVTRAYEPGCKFDYMAIFCGEQGSRKSTTIQILAGGENRYGVLDCDLGDKQKIAETIMGKWVIEMDEMEAMKKADHTTNKSFLRKQKDDVRLSYGRHVTLLKRTCILIGSTNERKILRDPTGNRSYWPVIVRKKAIDTSAFAAERPMLLAEAHAIYKRMRKEFPPEHGWLDLSLSPEAVKEAKIIQEEMRTREMFEEMVDSIEDYIDTPITLAEYLREGKDDRLPYFHDDADGPDPEDVWILRTRWAKTELTEAALGRNRQRTSNPAEQLNVERALDSLRKRLSFKKHYRIGGKTSSKLTFYHLTDASPDEIKLGYRPVKQDDDFDPLG